MADEYEPTAESLSAHPVPDWFADAKLGVFVHWGIYSVPAWAPPPEEGHAYAEWYPRYMYVEGSPTREYHREQYGDREYLDFVEEWRAENWDPEEWAAFFDDVGARYVVLTGEHHDGFPLWPTHYTKHNAAEMGPERDLVGDLCAAVRDRGLKFAASYHANLNYYQPGFEGPFGHPDYHGTEPFEDTRPGPEYVDFMDAKHRELIRRYEPDLLWFDTPQADAETLRAHELLADYYNRAAEWGKEVVANDRAATDAHADFVTPEYETFDEIREEKWEACRGVGHSFGYNARETREDHLSTTDLVRLFVDVVSKNGNLLINVGPRADGTIPDLQREPLEGLGGWLDRYGDAVYGTRPWAVSEDDAAAVPVRYTHRDGTLYATLFEWPGGDLDLAVGRHADPGSVERVAHVGGEECPYEPTDDGVRVSLPAVPPEEHPAYAFALDGVPAP
jgi:alpha-L-fucosidase